jgi:hypothetical protein
MRRLPDGVSAADPAHRSLAERSGEAAAREVHQFVKDTVVAAVQEIPRLLAHAAGVGVAYEAVHCAWKELEAFEALSAAGGTVDLPVPVHPPGVDLIVRWSTGDSQGERKLPTIFLAPDDGPLVGALGLEPVKQDGGEHARPAHADGNDQAEIEPGRGGIRANRVAAEDRHEVTGNLPTAEGQSDDTVVVVIVNLDPEALGGGSPVDHVGVLRRLARQNLLPELATDHRTRNLELVIGYDPATRLAFWVRPNPGPSRAWRILAKLSTVTGLLTISTPEPAELFQEQKLPVWVIT